MDYKKVAVGIAIIGGFLVFIYQGWESAALVCSLEQQTYDPVNPPLHPFECDLTMDGLINSIVIIVVPIIGIGTWLVVFGLKEISLVSFKKAATWLKTHNVEFVNDFVERKPITVFGTEELHE